MVVFPSERWVKEFCKLINRTDWIKKDARTWEGDIVFVIESDAVLKRELEIAENDPALKKLKTDTFEKIGITNEDDLKEIYVYADLWHGECRGARLLKSMDEVNAAFVLRAKYGIWKRIVNQELSPIVAIMTMKMKVNPGKSYILTQTKAALGIGKLAGMVPSTTFIS